MTPRNEQCRWCKYWGGDRGNKADIADCRRNPPTAEHRWPQACGTDWCGEYEQIGERED